MSHLRHCLIVAGWEFRRYFKWKDQIIGLIFFLGISGVWYGVAKVLQGRGRTITVAVVDMNLQAPPSGRLEFVSAPPTDSARIEGLRAGDLDGVLSRGRDGTFDLLVEQDPRYQAELQALLNAISQGERLGASGLSPQDLAAINAPAPLDVRFTDPTRQQTGTAEKIIAGVLIGVMLISVFTSMAYLMTGIAGEKQLRVTESVVSAISPQAWIDGKVIGLTAYSLTGIVNLALGGLVVGISAKLATDFAIPKIAIRPGIVLVIAVVAILGMILWNCFFAAVAATIDDPNTSTRSSMLMLPAIPVGLAVVVFRDPDSLLSHLLAVFPLTSAPALPARMVLSNPGIVEILASLLLLIGAIWLTRRVAGRIFEVGMLLYGKEPSWREIARWVARPTT
jgi:ABC-2 type transport system permease protein